MHVPAGNGGFDGFEPLSNCDLIPIETEIDTPDMEVADSMNVGDVLKVALHFSGDSTVVVVKHKGLVAGEIRSQLVRRLPEYIVRGTDYTATLTGKDNGRLRVLIRAVE